MSKLNAYETEGTVGCDTDQMAGLSSPSQTFWFAFTTMQWQGFHQAPRSVASTVLSCFWMLFVTITLVTYTAAILQRFATTNNEIVSQPTLVPATIEDIILHPEIDYGVVRDGSEHHFFSSGKGPMFDAFRQYSDHHSAQMFVDAEANGIEQVRNSSGNYAFLCHSSVALWAANQKPCDLEVIHEQIPHSSVGLAFPFHYPQPVLEQFKRAMLLLHETRELDELHMKWFYRKMECWGEGNDIRGHPRRKSGSRSPKPEVGVDHVISLETFTCHLVLLVIGLLAAAVTAVAEMVYYKRNINTKILGQQSIVLDHQ